MQAHFIFLLHNATARKNKKSLQAHTPASADFRAKLDTTALRTDRKAADNSGFKKLAVQWLNQVQFSNQTFVQADSFVLRNRQLLKPANRYV